MELARSIRTAACTVLGHLDPIAPSSIPPITTRSGKSALPGISGLFCGLWHGSELIWIGDKVLVKPSSGSSVAVETRNQDSFILMVHLIVVDAGVKVYGEVFDSNPHSGKSFRSKFI